MSGAVTNTSTTGTASNLIMSRRTNTNSSGNFRAGYYAKLGIFPGALIKNTTTVAPQSPTRSLPRQSSLSPRSVASSCPPSPPCLRHKRSVLHTTPAQAQNGRVSFNPQVKLYRIKHHDDYSDEEWNNMWTEGDKLDHEKDRNTLEFVADGNDWRNATEEEDFQQGPDGTLMHPATFIAHRFHWERNGYGTKPVIDYRALLKQAPFRKTWSPRPVAKQRKSFWLFQLAMESVQKGKQAAGTRRPQVNHSINRHHPVSQPIRHGDRGFP